MIKSVRHRLEPSDPFWVGDGFPVRNFFSYDNPVLVQELSPFLHLDHGGPVRFEPTEKRRGVGEHPHRGFETVTIVYEGEVEHRDSSGGGGKIGPGDVQWMTAGSGVVHEEFHGREFAKKGGSFEMIQLWVNLPRAEKMTQPRYQGLLDAEMPRVSLPGEAGEVRILAGTLNGKTGPAQTFSPINVWDVRLNPNAKAELPFQEGQTLVVFAQNAPVTLSGRDVVEKGQMVLMERKGTELHVQAGTEGARVLILNGEPLNEPVAGYGPFVMSTPDEIRQAFKDYQNGKMGKL